MHQNSYNIAIIGGGIIGCALARELGKRFDRIVLLEKEDSVGFHTSSRNSGVVHSGFNPKPGTLKAKLCVEGSQMIREYCKDRSIPYEQVGTHVVAAEEAQIPVLYELKNRGEKNGVPGLEILPIERVRDYEPNVKGIASMFSPAGAIVDSAALTRSLADDARELGVTISIAQKVLRIVEKVDTIKLLTKDNFYTAELMINCAGLHADRLAHMMGLGRDYIIAPFRGEYFTVNRPGPPIIRSMVYPAPNLLVPFLGVHLTRTVEGSVLIGPNAVPAFGREQYTRKGINLRDLVEMASHKGIWNALIHNRNLINIAWNELLHSWSRWHFMREASKLVTGLCHQDLRRNNRVGIRPQLIRSDGHLVEDLMLESTSRSIHVLNAVSPGMTSALAFARWLSRGIDDKLRWKDKMLKSAA
jgi:L-2-hydroxyglutarate oxidase